jgi:hypothetical protein
VPDDRERLGLPVRPFLYTVDQVATILNITEVTLKRDGYLHFEGRTPGTSRMDELRVVNVASGVSDRPNWRIEERELVRWMKRKGFKYVDR